MQWKSKKQKLVSFQTMEAELVSFQTMEAELVSICEAWKTVRWISDVLQEIGHVPCHDSVIIDGNQSGIGILNSANFNSDSRYMSLRCHHLVEELATQSRLPIH